MRSSVLTPQSFLLAMNCWQMARYCSLDFLRAFIFSLMTLFSSLIRFSTSFNSALNQTSFTRYFCEADPSESPRSWNNSARRVPHLCPCWPLSTPCPSPPRNLDTFHRLRWTEWCFFCERFSIFSIYHRDFWVLKSWMMASMWLCCSCCSWFWLGSCSLELLSSWLQGTVLGNASFNN